MSATEAVVAAIAINLGVDVDPALLLMAALGSLAWVDQCRGKRSRSHFLSKTAQKLSLFEK